MIEAIVLAGGFGTRLRPITFSLHKLMVRLLGKPLVAHILDNLPKETDRVILAVHYLADQIREYVNSREDPWEYVVVKEEKPLGTGGAVKNLERYVGSDQFLVFNGDVIFSLCPEKLLNYNSEKGAIGSIAVYEVEDPTSYGVVVFDEENRIKEFIEKPKEFLGRSYINAGVYALKKEVFDYIPAGREVSIEREVFPKLIEKGLYAFPFQGYWCDCGTPGRLLHAKDILLKWKGMENYVGEGAKVKGKLISSDVERECIVEEGAVIENSILMDGVYVGKGAVIKRSVLGPGVRVPSGAYLDGCTIEGGVELEGKVRLINSKVKRRDRNGEAVWYKWDKRSSERGFESGVRA